MVYDIDIHELNLKPFINFKKLKEISFKKCVVFAFLNNKCIIIKILRKKPLPYQRGGDFIDGHSISFLIFFCLVMFHEPQT
jgi:hypothetical protein